MNRAKIIFNQTLMVSTGILFCMGVEEAVHFLLKGQVNLNWQWFYPISIVFVGFLCGLAAPLIYDSCEGSKQSIRVRVGLHCVLVFGLVSFFGYLFGWYSDVFGYLIVVVMYILVYVFVWLSTSWMLKADEKKINDAIDRIRDEE